MTQDFEFQPMPVLAALLPILAHTIREYDQAQLGDRLEHTFQERFDRSLETFCERYLSHSPEIERDLRRIRDMLQREIDDPSLP